MAKSDFDSAVAFARDSRRDTERSDREQGYDPDGVRAAADLLIGQPAEYLAAWLDGAISASRESKHEWDIIDNLARRVRPIPQPMAEWAAERPPRPRKGKRLDGRDSAIARCVFWIVEMRLATATRNRAAGAQAGDGVSACDAAGIAWNLTYLATEKIWFIQRGRFDGMRYGEDD